MPEIVDRHGALPWAKMLAFAFLATSAAHLPSRAETTLFVAAYGGTSEAAIKAHVLDPFAAEHGIRIEYVAGTSATNLARLQAQQGHQEIDLVILDDGPMQQAVELGLCSKIEPFEAMERLYPLARRNGQGMSLGLGLVATGIAYNRQALQNAGRQAPKSWLDLADPRNKGRLLVPSITNSYGLHTLIALQHALMANEIESAFSFFEDQVASNVFSFETSSGKISELLQTQQVDMAVWGSGRALALAKSGFPIGFVIPEEGAVALQTTICPVTGSDLPELSQLLLQRFYQPEVQSALAREAGWGPTNRDTELDAETAKTVPYGLEAVDAMIDVDWSFVNAKRGEWTRRWTRKIEN